MELVKELVSSKIWIFEDDIIWQDYKLTKSINLEEAKEMCKAVNDIAQFVPKGEVKLMSTMTGILSMDKKVRTFSVNYPTQYNWKIALVYGNSTAFVFSSLLLKLLKIRFKTKSFKDIKKAVEWLRDES